jgi:hypothetical protein
MARLSANGSEIGTIYRTKDAIRYMSNGAILKNRGMGWKHAGKVKPDTTPQAAFERAKTKQEEFLSSRPALRAFRAAMHDACGLAKRSRLYWAIQAMPNDADGVWSTVCDGWDGLSLDVDECGHLCRLYLAALNESRGSQMESA